jgi:FtsP/CotA-like multicopper oxidase with cupredoxin domain
MTTGVGPYVVPIATDSDDTGPGSPALETTLVASEQVVDIVGTGATVHAEVFNGAIPGPTLRLNLNDTVVVRLVNDLPHPTGIHWHGVELENYSDGTEVTQDGVAGAPLQTLGNGVPAGGTFLYKFKVPRPGVFWYHPHHHNSLNRVFRGMYGMIVVTDPLEANIVSTPGVDRALPAATDTLQLVLSDITVCGATNATTTYVDPTSLPPGDGAEWLSGATAQAAPSPRALCEIAPAGSATNDDGSPRTAADGGNYGAGFVPSGLRPPGGVNFCEGQTVLTNGMNVGGRLGTPAAPRGLVTPAPAPKSVLSGQGLRLQIVNCAVIRYFRLRLTYPDGAGVGVQIPLTRIGGEGGLLDNAILEGGMVGGVDTRFGSGEILLPPATRADVVMAIHAGLAVGTVLTLWTRDFQRTGGTLDPNNWAQFPTVPVMHMIVTGAKPGTPYTIVGGNVNATPPGGTALRAPAGMPALEDLTGLPTGSLLPGPASPPRPAGFVNDNITMRTSGGAPNIDQVPGMFMAPPGSPYSFTPHLASSRYATEGQLLQLQVTNFSNAHHPFHLHGFSFQPVSLQPRSGAPAGITGSFTYPYREFRDTIDLPRQRTLTFRVRLDPRALADGTSPGGAFGRWLFHCHIFFHHLEGMVSELVVTTPAGAEKPSVNVGGSWAYSSIPGTATRRGTYHSPSGLNVALAATRQNGMTIGTIVGGGATSGTWTWTYTAPVADTARTEYVYITATDSTGRKEQAVFRFQVGGADNGSDVGDPHLRTVDGTRYDFQAAGEFTLLRDREAGIETQVRQTPVQTPPPITDSYSGLTACVSLNTALAARLGSHRISYQPVEQGRYRFFLDGKAALLTKDGIDLDDHRVSAFDAGSEQGLRVDFANNMVLTATPRLWTSYGIWYIDVSVSNTQADEGIMGRIPKGTWLPSLSSGATVGPKPESLYERYVALYQTFANAWRVTDQTSMFWYAPGTSTATFTDEDWPPAPVPQPGEFAPPPTACKLKPGFQKPITPILATIDIAEAKRICKGVTLDDLNAACVFDVAATGDEEFAQGYFVAQDIRLNSTTVHVVGDKPQTESGKSLVVTATVAPLSSGRPTPTGSVTFLVDGVAAGLPVALDAQSRASFTTNDLEVGVHRIRATYVPSKTYHPSSSPNLLHTVTTRDSGAYGRNVICVPTLWIWILLLLLLLLILIILILALRG